jgi:protein-S-isoprenylcysteine O-methyltransferase Ste14
MPAIVGRDKIAETPMSAPSLLQPNILPRAFALVYGIVAYLVFLASFLYSVGFVGNLSLPVTIDSGQLSPALQAIGIDLALLSLFAVQHSTMARPSFKRWWTRIIPASIERSTYVLLSSLALLSLFWQWRPIPDTVWSVTDPLAAAAIAAVYWIGWAVALGSTFLTSHFQLFGLSQVFTQFFNRTIPAPLFKTTLFYRYVRHPLYFGFLLAFWAAPSMTAGHLLFALATTGYILIGVQLEERDLIGTFGEDYRRYRRQVAMLVPMPQRKFPAREAAIIQDPVVGEPR